MVEKIEARGRNRQNITDGLSTLVFTITVFFQVYPSHLLLTLVKPWHRPE
jgi:hypothetical protein